MSQKFILAGVGTVKLIDPSTKKLIVTSKTLTDSGINFTVTAEDIRGGMANALLGQYFHDSGLGLTLTDALFSMEYLKLNVGGDIVAGTNTVTSESVTSTSGKITVANDPKDFFGLGTIGWYTEEGKDDWTQIDFVGKDATVPNLEAGKRLCVQYAKEDSSARELTVSSAFIPSQCMAILTLPLFKAGTENATSYTSSSKVGEVQVAIPNFILAGAQDLSLTSSGASTTALSGSALVTYDGSEGCDGDGYYAKIIEVTYNKNEFDGVKTIVVADSDIDLAVGEKQTIEVYAMYNDSTAPRKVDASKITFSVVEGDTIASVANTGEVTGDASGSAVVECTITEKSDLVATAHITVTA